MLWTPTACLVQEPLKGAQLQQKPSCSSTGRNMMVPGPRLLR